MSKNQWWRPSVQQKLAIDSGGVGGTADFAVEPDLPHAPFSRPKLYFPIPRAGETTGAYFACGLVTVAAGESVIAGVQVVMPNLGGPGLSLIYVEMNAINLDGTEACSVYTEVPIAAADNATTDALPTDFTGSNVQTGSDLSLDQGDGNGIMSTAGGTFFVSIGLDAQLAS